MNVVVRVVLGHLQHTQRSLGDPLENRRCGDAALLRRVVSVTTTTMRGFFTGPKPMNDELCRFTQPLPGMNISAEPVLPPIV